MESLKEIDLHRIDIKHLSKLNKAFIRYIESCCRKQIDNLRSSGSCTDCFILKDLYPCEWLDHDLEKVPCLDNDLLRLIADNCKELKNYKKTFESTELDCDCEYFIKYNSDRLNRLKYGACMLKLFQPCNTVIDSELYGK